MISVQIMSIIRNFFILQAPVQSGSNVHNPLMSLTVDSTSSGTEDNTSVSEGLSTKVTAVDKEGDAKHIYIFNFSASQNVYITIHIHVLVRICTGICIL